MYHEAKNTIVIETIKRAWQQLNPGLLREALADNIEWHETPFDKPLRGADAVINQWEKDLAGQTNVAFKYEVLFDHDGKQSINWHCIWTVNNSKRELDGVFYFELNNNDKLMFFKQWAVAR